MNFAISSKQYTFHTLYQHIEIMFGSFILTPHSIHHKKMHASIRSFYILRQKIARKNLRKWKYISYKFSHDDVGWFDWIESFGALFQYIYVMNDTKKNKLNVIWALRFT